MEYLTHELISKKISESICSKLLFDKENWEDGKKTAGSQAIKIKNNLQLNRNSSISKELTSFVQNALLTDQLIKSFTIPKKIHGLMFTRTSSGKGYGMHIDNPYMSSGRSDLSFTLFLNEMDQYSGGELAIQDLQNSRKIKLPAGSVIVYPSTSLHSVEKVISGERIVCVGWIESYVSSNEERNTLFGLDAGSKALLAKYGRSDELDLIFQAYANLLRILGD